MLESIELEITGVIDPRAGSRGFEKVPIYPHQIRYSASISSLAAPGEIEALYQAVERNCPILNLLRQPQAITGEIGLSQKP